MGLYNFVIFIMRPADRAPLYFSLFSLLIFLNNFVSDGSTAFLLESFAQLHHQLLQKIDFLTVMASIPVFIMFLHAFFPGLGNRILLKYVQITVAMFVALTAVSNGVTTGYIFNCFFVIILLMIAYSVLTGIGALKRKMPDSKGVMTGIVIMSIAGINDLCWGIRLYPTIILIPAATFIFTFIYSVLISRRFSNALTSAERLAAGLIENQRLKVEMQHHILQQQNLHHMQHLLTGMLHSLDMPICAVNDSGAIVFCNRAFEGITGKTLAMMAGNDAQLYIDSKNRDTEMMTVPMELDDEQISVLLFSSGSSLISSNAAANFLEELQRNRFRIRSLEELLKKSNPEMIKNNPRLGHDITMIDTALQQMGQIFGQDTTAEEMKINGFEVISLTIRYWSECTQKTKFELAEESGLWKVQVNPDGWKRTQTLDRYLDIKTFPQNPRWNQIIKTADFVLIRCQVQSELRNQLEIAFQKLVILA
jgi:hypothetical protein